MNITYLIGNGFDVNIGLKSRYADFYNAYVKIHSDDEPDVVKRFKAGINGYIKKESAKDDLETIDWRDLEVALGQFTDQMDEYESEILYLDINDRMKEYLEEELRHFDAGAFNRSDFYDHLTNPITNHFNRVKTNELKNYFTGFSGEEHYNVINFNYTDTVEKLADFKGKRLSIGSSFIGRQAYLDSVLHIHHTLRDEEILIGVNDVSQIANKYFSDFIHNSQFLLTPEVDGKKVPFDLIPISNGECRKDIYFEISSFFGKRDNTFLSKPVKTEQKLKAFSELIDKK